MKLSLVEPFAARPATENVGEFKKTELSSLVIPEIDTQLSEEFDSQSQQHSQQQRQQIAYIDFIKQQKQSKSRSAVFTEKDVKRIINAYQHVDEGRNLEDIGARLDKAA